MCHCAEAKLWTCRRVCQDLGLTPAPAAYYANCAAVRAAGAAPIPAGQPGYSLDLDRDGDGIACE